MSSGDDVINSLLNSVAAFLAPIIKEKQESTPEEVILFPPVKRLDGGRAKSPIDAVTIMMRNAYDFEARRRDERLRQARLSFNAALVLLIIGTLVVLAGVVLLFRNQNITAGIVTSGAGVISNFFSAILFKFSRDANDRLDKIKTNLAKIEAYQQALTAISENRKAAKK